MAAICKAIVFFSVSCFQLPVSFRKISCIHSIPTSIDNNSRIDENEYYLQTNENEEVVIAWIGLCIMNVWIKAIVKTTIRKRNVIQKKDNKNITQYGISLSCTVSLVAGCTWSGPSQPFIKYLSTLCNSPLTEARSRWVQRTRLQWKQWKRQNKHKTHTHTKKICTETWTV